MTILLRLLVAITLLLMVGAGGKLLFMVTPTSTDTAGWMLIQRLKGVFVISMLVGSLAGIFLLFPPGAAPSPNERMNCLVTEQRSTLPSSSMPLGPSSLSATEEWSSPPSYQVVTTCGTFSGTTKPYSTLKTGNRYHLLLQGGVITKATQE